jgi:NADP-dependent 3-hydroxy acid dehydrogenase YdfG
MMNRDNPVWLITGCSTGFGRELAKLVLERGWRAVVTARDASKVADIVEGHGDRALVLPLDVTKRAQIDHAVAQAKEHFGRIDVLVNNAGYGYLAAIEEGEDAAVREMFEANVFGLIDTTKAVLPVMRKQRSGLIVNVSSIGGLTSFAATGYYHGTKYAVEGISESLATEVKPLGIGADRRTGPVPHQLGGAVDQAVGDRRSRIMRPPPASAASRPPRAAAIRRATRCAPRRPSSTPRCPTRRRCVCCSARPRSNWRKKLDFMRGDFDAWEATTVGADFPEGTK